MNKIIPLSLMAIVSLYAAEVELAPISVESTLITEVSANAQVSADLGEALSTSVPSIDMSRRSGIANDVLIRGQKRDNISVEVDGTKVCGACPNRMDPPVSHVLANQIEEVTVTEGPYDVETLGTMSGGIKIKTKAPTKDFHGEVNMGYGSFNYRKVGATFSGGNDIVRVLVSGSSESSDQYKDGNGDTLSQQAAKGATSTSYLSNYEDMDSYKKNSIMTKAFVTTAENQELRLSYTANRSTNVMYANTPMDAISDDSNIYSIEYNIDNVGDAYKNVNLQYYYSDVDHPMSNEYRTSSNTATMVNHMNTTMQGMKLKNNFDIQNYKFLVGLDSSKRTWEGQYTKTITATSATSTLDSLALTSTYNSALFAKLEKTYGDFEVKVGARYDLTQIETEESGYDSENYTSLNANIFATYNLNKENKFFIGFGQASRVPDARELYSRDKSGNIAGTPGLDQTTNREIDFGYETDNNNFKLKIKAFYSMLEDYIYYQVQSSATEKFKNIDATIYGAEISASIYATDAMTVDMGASYKKGKKDEALTGQTDTDLADIAPLRGKVALNYEYKNASVATIEVQASDKWSDYDEDNDEQEIDAWATLNMKVKHAVNKNFDFTLGVNNLLDETYATSNTYADLTLITDTTSTKTLLNDPGRYVYTNLTFKF
jgi:iron complex outermembrane receptor protein